MKALRIAALFFFLLSNVYAQIGNSPYPIIFVHGLVGSDETFKETMDYLNRSEISFGPINVFNVILNADNDATSSILEQDVKWIDFIYEGKQIHVGRKNYVDNLDKWNASSIYAINFKEERIPQVKETNGLFDGSNQSAIFKQGYALKAMINEVLQFTGAKKVILVGHSMGGLAIREYLQRTNDGTLNSARRWWIDPSDSQFGHKVARVVTIGTPHLGSNAYFDPTSPLSKIRPNSIQDEFPPDKNEEAMRDLKYSYDSYPGCNLLKPVGIYLFGGGEECLKSTTFNQTFVNTDINCNGSEKDFIPGINAYNSTTFNQKMPLPANIEYTWIASDIGRGELPWHPASPGDGAVLLDRQWLYDDNHKPAPLGSADTLLTQKRHDHEGGDYYAIIRGLDEPDSYSLAYEIPLGVVNKGFITFQQYDRPLDTDFFKVITQQKGELLIEIKGSNSGVGQIAILDANLNPPVSTTLNPGTYYIRVTGNATSKSWNHPYSLTVTLKPGGTNNPLTVTTTAATNVTHNSAQLNGSVNPNGASTEYYFEYGTTTSYGFKTNSVNAGLGTSAVSVNSPITGLSPSSIYHFRLVATNNGGTKNGNDLIFTTSPPPPQGAPIVTTVTATNVTHNSAQLNGSVNPNSANTTYYFEYGTTINYGSKTNSVSAGSGTNAVFVNSPITGLSPSTTYHFRLVATNSGGTNYGSDLTFTTSPQQGAPTVTTTVATNVTHNSAQLNGTVNPSGASTTYYFEYGTTTDYGSTTSIGNAGSGTSLISVNSSITGLSASSIYHFRLVATNSGGTNRGGDLTFTTSAPPTQSLPYVEAGNTANVTCSSAQLNGTVNPNGLSTTVWVECSQSPDLVNPIITPSQTIGSGTSAVPFSQTVTGLSPSTEYFCRIKANNSAGTRSGSQMNFTTTVCGAPTVETKPATSITPSSAQLNGTIKSNAGDTRFYYEWGTSTSYGSKTSEQGPAYWTEAHPIPNSVYDLNPNTTYHFRLVARNSAGTSYGNDLAFTTLATPPAVTTTTAMNVTHDSAQLNGSVNPNGASTTYYFEYGATANYGSKTNNANAGSGTSAASVNSPITGLSPNTTYHFRLAATNSGGTNNGKDLTFTTLAIPLPATASYGNILGGDRSRQDKVTYSFTGQAGPLFLSYQVYDIDTKDEVKIFLNGTKITNVDITKDTAWSPNRGVVLRDALVNNTTPNLVVFDNTKNPPGALLWGVRQVAIEGCFLLPSVKAYGKIIGGDQTHADRVVYWFGGRPGNLSLTYEVYGIDDTGELDILFNGTKIRDEAITANNSWSAKRTLLLTDAQVNDKDTNVLIFDNTKNLPNTLPSRTLNWGVMNVSVAPTAVVAVAVDLSHGFSITGNKVQNVHSLFDGQTTFPERLEESETAGTHRDNVAAQAVTTVAPEGHLLLSFPKVQQIDYLLLYPEENSQRSFCYRFEASLDGEKWQTLVDKTATPVQGIQFDQIPSAQTRFLRISGRSYIYDWKNVAMDEMDEETYRQKHQEMIAGSKPMDLAIAELAFFKQDSTAAVTIEETVSPASFHLAQNFPNPFNPTTNIRFSTPSAGRVKLTVYNLHGKEVRTLINGEVPAGAHLATFDGSDLASGIYFCRLEAGELVATQKMVLTK